MYRQSDNGDISVIIIARLRAQVGNLLMAYCTVVGRCHSVEEKERLYGIPFAKLLSRIEVENCHFRLLYSGSDPSRGTTLSM